MADFLYSGEQGRCKMQILVIIREVLATPALLVGFVTLVGLLLQKKPVDHIVKGTVTAIVGFVLLSAGSEYLQNGPLKDFGILFRYVFHIQGVIPNMEAISSLGITKYATEVSEIMLFGMFMNLIMARFGPFRYIFLTGHHTMYMACLLAVVLHGCGIGKWQIVIGSSLMLGLLMAVMPAAAQKSMRKVTGGDKLALGHFSVFGYLVSTKVAELVTEHDENKKSTEEIHFPAKLSFMRDSTTGIFIVMTILFLILSGAVEAQTDLSRVMVSYQSGGYQNWIIYAVIQGAKFSVAIYIILAGVRLIIAEVVPAFKGIARKIVPDAKPAVDCPILFSYAPNAVMIGFLMSFLGGIIAMTVLLIANTWLKQIVIPVIVPGVVAHFFCGGSAGVFANAEGGVKGCVIGSFIHGILISVLPLLVMPVLGILNLSGTTFSDSDFCMVGIVFGNVVERIPAWLILPICILCFVLPIAYEQCRIRKKKENRT